MVSIPVTVGYGTDLELACRLLTDIAAKHPRVIADPQAAARVKSLGESGVDIELYTWIADPSVGEAAMRSELLIEIVRAFQSHRIEVPYPRRDVRVLATPETQEKPSTSGT
jgi:small-conductance mechanosensitive channel